MSTSWSRPTKYLVGVALTLLAIYILYLSRSVISVLVIAALIAMIVRPIILWLQNRARLPRGVAVAIVYLVGIIIVPLAVILAVPAIVTAVNYVLSQDYQSIFTGVLEWLRSTLAYLKSLRIPVESLDMYVDQIADALLAEIQPAAPSAPAAAPAVSSILRSLGTALTTTFGAVADVAKTLVSQITLTIFLILSSVYMSASADRYREWFLRGLPEQYRGEIAMLMERIARMWNAFFRGELTLMIIIGFMSWLGLTILGVPGAVYLGITAGLLELIPSLGPVIATVPAAIVALLQGSTWLPVSHFVLMLLVIGLYWLIQQLENSLIVPRTLGDAVELPALVVMTGVLVGATSAGVLGALLATPVIATGREILRYIYHKMLGTDPYPPEKESPRPAGQVPLWQQNVVRWVRRTIRRRKTPAPVKDQELPPPSDLESEAEPLEK